MADRDDPNKRPNPAFLQTRVLGSRNLADIDYDDDQPTGSHTSERPPRQGPPPQVAPEDVFYLTDRPPRAAAALPSFSDTLPGPANHETARADLPPVAPVPREVSPLAHSPLPPMPSVALPVPSSQSLPMPLVARASRPCPRRPVKRRHTWKRVLPPPRFPPSEPLAKPVPVRPDVLGDGPKPVEDRLLNALAVLTLGMIVTALAGFSFLVVTQSRVEALAPFISQPWAASPASSASSFLP